MAQDDLRRNAMMNHLLGALERHEDIGHYGRLVFAMVARHFVERGELVDLLAHDRDTDEAKALALVEQVEARDYSPPRRARIAEWQAKQSFVICPDLEDPDQGNVYRDLEFPDHVYKHIEEYREDRARHELHDGALGPRVTARDPHVEDDGGARREGPHDVARGSLLRDGRAMRAGGS